MEREETLGSPAFGKAVQHIFEFEGGFVHHPEDPGGATNLGITRRTLADWRGVRPWWDLPVSAVRGLTKNEAAHIYHAKYWLKCRCDLLPDAVGLTVFDYAVNSGPFRAVTALQGVVDQAQDGILGPKTQLAISAWIQNHGEAQLIDKYLDNRLRFLKALPTFKTFGRGWTRRVAAVRMQAKSLVSDRSQKTEKKGLKMNILSGYKTYIIALAMLAAGLAQLAGIELPGFDGQSALQLVAEALAIMFLRKGITTQAA